jgi:hypothetical protein
VVAALDQKAAEPFRHICTGYLMPVRLVGRPMTESVKSSESSSGIEISKGIPSHRFGRSTGKVSVESLRAGDFNAPPTVLAASEDCKTQFYGLIENFWKIPQCNEPRHLGKKPVFLSLYIFSKLQNAKIDIFNSILLAGFVFTTSFAK